MIFTEPDKAVGSEIIIQLPEIIITDNMIPATIDETFLYNKKEL